MIRIRQFFQALAALLFIFQTVLSQESSEDFLAQRDQHLAQELSQQAIPQYDEGTQASNEDEEALQNYVRRGGNRNLGILDRAWDALSNNRQGNNQEKTVEEYDIVIIGAGMAGLAAAKEIQDTDSSLTYVILESTNAVGGRVRSTTFGATGREVTIEDGANWLYSNNDYPTWQLAKDLGIESTESVYSDFTMYNETVSFWF
jgi:Flavin containing amine oxidoreductase